MFRPAWRAASAATAAAQKPIGRRLASTSTRSTGTWRGAAVRWGLAGAAVYYYNTSPVFAEGAQSTGAAIPEVSSESDQLSTIDSIASQRKAQARALSESKANQSVPTTTPAAQDEIDNPDALEEEASQQGAFNEETGEINWDCPCLGGMAHGPCGTEFRAAFSCFVFSKEEPKGVDCIEHFKTMQNCFREHPEMYGAELDDDDAAPVDGLDEPSGGVVTPGEPQPIAAATSAVADSKLAEEIRSPDAAPIYKPVEVAVEQVKQDIQDFKEIPPRL